MPTLGPPRRDVLIDRDTLHIGALLTGVVPDVIDPTRVVDEHLEGRIPAVEDVVELEPGLRCVVATLRVAVPPTAPQFGETLVGGIEGCDLLVRERPVEKEIPPQVEQVVVEGCRSGHGTSW